MSVRQPPDRPYLQQGAEVLTPALLLQPMANDLVPRMTAVFSCNVVSREETTNPLY